MKNNWDDFKFVLALSRYGTLTSAAENLGANAATVSRRVTRLEDSLGVRLFERSDIGWRATNVAERLIDLATRFDGEVRDVQRQVEAVRDEPEGLLTISGVSFINTVALIPNIGALRAAYPRLSPVLEYSQKPHSLAFGEADIALRVSRPTEGRLVVRKLAEFRLGIYRNPAFEPQEGWAGLISSYDQTPAMQGAYAHFGTEPVLRVNSVMNLWETTRFTGFAAPLPTCVAQRSPDLVPVIDPENFKRNQLWLVFHETVRGDAKVRAGIEWLESIFPNPNGCICGRCTY